MSPASGFSYITRSLRQTAPFVVGALRLLAETYTPAELNKHGFALYAEFRPEVDGWGAHGEVRCERILSLRKGERLGLVMSPSQTKLGTTGTNGASNIGLGSAAVIKFEQIVDQIEDNDGLSARNQEDVKSEEPDKKKPKAMSLEEYEALLDDDDTFANVDLDLRTPGEGT